MKQNKNHGTYCALLRPKLITGEIDSDRKLSRSRPQCIKKPAEAEGRDEHKGNKLHQHGAEREDHEVVL